MTGAVVLARVRRALLLVGLVFAALPVGSALADTTIGQTGSTPSITSGQVGFADTNYVVPSGGGTITSFSFQSDSTNASQQLDFLVLRPAGGSNYTVIGKTGLVTLQGTGSETFSQFAPIAVQGGDILGFWAPSLLSNPLRFVGAGVGGAILGGPGSDPNVGDTISLPTALGSYDLNESANLVVVPADLKITKSGSPDPVGSGQQLTYTIKATNAGGQSASGVSVTDPLPASAHFDSVSTTQGTCTRSTSGPKTKGGTVSCSLGSLGGGNSATITIVVTATKPGTLTNTATVAATGITADADDSAAATTTVTGT